MIGHQIGSLMIDLLDPKPEQMDLPVIYRNLSNMRRFNGHPKALTIRQHSELVVKLVELDRNYGFPTNDEGHFWNYCRDWARHHDDHEGILGDIVGPVKSLISSRCNILEITEVKIDKALCLIRGTEYPSDAVRSMVHRYDKAAETIEWSHALDHPLEPWNAPCPAELYDIGPSLIHHVREKHPHG